MAQNEWKQNACGLCYVNCGIEVQTEGRKITRVRGDKAHPHSAGATDDELRRLIAGCWSGRRDRYSEQRAAATARPRRRVEMFQVGG